MTSARALFVVGALCAGVLLTFADNAVSQDASTRRQTVLNDANALRSRGEMALMVDEPAEAERLVLRSIEAVESEFGRDHREVAFFRAALARVYRAQGRLSEAAAQNDAALRIDPDASLSLLLEIGEIALQQGRAEEARAAFTRSLQAVTSDVSYRQRAYGGLGSVEFRRKAWREAVGWWSLGTEQAVETLRASALFRRQSLGAVESAADFSERQVEQFYGFVRAAYRASQQDGSLREPMAARAFEIAQWVTLSRAGEAINQMAARFAPSTASDSKLLRDRQDLSTRWQSLNETRGAMRASRPETDAEVVSIASEMKKIDVRLASIDRQLGDGLPTYVKAATPSAISLRDVQTALRGDEVLLFVVTVPAMDDLRGETYLWAVSRDRIEWLQSDLDNDAIQEFVDATRCGVDSSSWNGAGRTTCERLLGGPPQASLPFDTRRSFAFHRRLLSPSKLATGSKNLLVVARGALTKIPLHLLVATEPAKSDDFRKVDWLVRTKAISVLPTVSSLIAFRSVALRSNASKEMIGFGNPLLTGHPTATVSAADVETAANEARRITSCALSGARRAGGARDYAELTRNREGRADIAQIRWYQPLPETADELCAVASHLKAPDGDIHLAGMATETSIKMLSQSGELEKYRVVYFATHGVTASRLRGLSEPGLILTPPDTASSTDDGYLSSSEIASLALDAEFVVLSACNTAAGSKATDEPLSGIAQAFFYAKARALLVSHWAVDSSAAVDLTTVAFRYLADNKLSRAEALRFSMAALIDQNDGQYAHPRFWGAFAFVGDPAN